MPIPAFDPKPQNEPLIDEIKAAWDRVLRTGVFIGGEAIEGLEKEFAAAVGSPHAIAVSSGTDALLAALMALGIGPQSAVLTAPFTFFASAGVIHRLGAEPVFADIDPKTFNLCPARTADTLKARAKGRARPIHALMPVHLFGQCADMAALRALAEPLGIPIVEDACQAYGARSHGRAAGTIGDIAGFSFYPTKNLGGVGDGGIVTTSDAERAATVKRLRNHGMKETYLHTIVGGNFRLDALQAAALRVKLPHAAKWNASRVELARAYGEAFRRRGLEEIVQIPHVAPGNEHVYHQYVIRTQRRDELKATLAAKGIGSAVYYPIPLHQQPCFAHLGYTQGSFPEAERAAREVLALPMYPGLSRADVDTVVEAIGAALRG